MNVITNKKTGAVLTVLLSILLFSCTNQSKKISRYYVSLNGNDANSGAVASPFRTIKKGVSVLDSGDTLIVLPGNYGYEFAITLSKSGTKKNPIVIMAEKPGTVYLKGPRKDNEVDMSSKFKDCGSGSAIVVNNVSHVVIDGFNVSNYRVGIDVGMWDSSVLNIEHPENKAHDVIVKNCTLDKNAGDGIQVFRVDSVLISNCTFISDFLPNEENGHKFLDAIQDYGCNFYSSTASVVENCYFYGSHNQALSFKEGDVDCIARKNIFEGAPLYTAIYLGQNRIADNSKENKNPSCNNLIAEYNVVRGAKGFRVKSPIRVDNVINAIVRNNYFEGFDDTHNTGGVTILDEVRGKIEINNNILAFSADKDISSGVFIMNKVPLEAQMVIRNNTFYHLAKDINGNLDKNDIFEKNIIFKCKPSLAHDKNNFYGNPHFLNGLPKQLPLTSLPIKPKFDEYYFKVTKSFILKEDSPAKDYGAKILLK